MRYDPDRERRNRRQSNGLLERLVRLFAFLGWAFVVAGVLVYTLTAPPLGGMGWDGRELAVAVILFASGIAILIARDLQ